MKKIAVVFAGGTGQRMGGEIPKQFLKVGGKEIIILTLELFESNKEIDEIYVVCLEDWISYLKEKINKFSIKKVISIVPGGISGQDSIFIGLNEVKKNNNNAIVLIHDGVRPLLSEETISKCIEVCNNCGNAITATPCYETPIISDDGLIALQMPERKNVYTAQAPQCFYLNDIYEMHLKERKENPDYLGIVDSCGLMYKNGVRCHLVIGNRGNIKVTTPEDYFHLIGNLNARDYQEFLSISKINEEVVGGK